MNCHSCGALLLSFNQQDKHAQHARGPCMMYTMRSKSGQAAIEPRLQATSLSNQRTQEEGHRLLGGYGRGVRQPPLNTPARYNDSQLEARHGSADAPDDDRAVLLVLAECAVGRNFVGAGPAVWQSPRGFRLATDTGTLMLQTAVGTLLWSCARCLQIRRVGRLAAHPSLRLLYKASRAGSALCSLLCSDPVSK